MRARLSLLLVLALFAGCSEKAGPVQGRDKDDVAAVDPSPEEVSDPAIDLRFAAIGDFGTGEGDQYAVAERMCRWREKHPFDLVVTTGDNVYPDGAPKDFEEHFFEPMSCLLENGVRFRASLGNHDVATDDGRPELEEPAFGMPARNYVVRRGGVRFVVANSNDFRMQWLQRALQAKEGDRWTIAVFHHPVFSAGATHGSTPGLADKLHGLFTQAGVDLVLTGHDHVYSVSKEQDGIRYVVTGGGGAASYGCKAVPEIDLCMSRLHFLYLRATEDAIKVKAIAPTGAVIDRFETPGLD